MSELKETTVGVLTKFFDYGVGHQLALLPLIYCKIEEYVDFYIDWSTVRG